VNHLQGVLDQGYGDQMKIADHFERLRDQSFTFRSWAEMRLKKQYGAVVGGVDPATFATALLNLLNSQEQVRRKEVKESLERHRFRSWEDIKLGR
jgi:hypothetical protein